MKRTTGTRCNSNRVICMRHMFADNWSCSLVDKEQPQEQRRKRAATFGSTKNRRNGAESALCPLGHLISRGFSRGSIRRGNKYHQLQPKLVLPCLSLPLSISLSSLLCSLLSYLIFFVSTGPSILYPNIQLKSLSLPFPPLTAHTQPLTAATAIAITLDGWFCRYSGWTEVSNSTVWSFYDAI